jgi:hypothetical protein
MVPVVVVVATVVVLLLHVPPGIATVKPVLWPAHILPAPLMAPGDGFTVMVVVTVHPEQEPSV